MTHHPPPLLPTNSLKISSQSTQSSFAACKDDVQQKTDSVESTSSNSKGKRKVGESLKFARKKKKVEGLMRSLKIRMYPNVKQKVIMKHWLGCAR